MKVLKIIMMSSIAVLFISSVVIAAGDLERGKKLFNDPRLADGTTGKSCGSCHPDGKGLENTADKKEWKIMGKKYRKLEDAINYNVEVALHGKAIDPKSQEMADIVEYLKSLKQ